MLACAIRDISEQNKRLLVDAQHRLRAKVFSDRLGWNVTVEDDREYDEFDTLSPTYILALSGNDDVVGCARLLPALGPTMLERTFPHLLSAGQLGAHARMVESSRFCVDTSLAEGRGPGLHLATQTMFAGIIEWAIANGFSEIVTATDLRFERILSRAGWPMQRLGEPSRIGNTVAVAGILSADRLSFDRVRPANYRSTIVSDRASTLKSAA
ncbi:MAG: acyl-homoserine-lactone synthase TraI [Pseudaminobacter sp.]